MKSAVLVVGGDGVRSDLKVILQDDYSVLEAKNGEIAVNYLENLRTHVALVIMDFELSKMSGLDVVNYMIEEGFIGKIPVIMVSRDVSEEEEEKALEMGVSDIIYKPFREKRLLNRISNVLKLFKDKVDVEEVVAKRTEELFNKAEELKASKDEVEKNKEFLINTLCSAIEFRSFDVGDHIPKIKTISSILLHKIKELYPKYELTDENIHLMVEASALHDLGKIAIHESILTKPGKLLEKEYEEVKKHTIYGCELLEKFRQDDNEFYRYCYEICRYHHERVDGAGYPEGLVGDEIPIWAQVVGFADVFEALVSQRVYKKAYEVNFAIAMIYNCECGTFSEEIINAFDETKEDIFKIVNL